MQRTVKLLTLVCVGILSLGLFSCSADSPEAITKQYLEGLRDEFKNPEEAPLGEEFRDLISSDDARKFGDCISKYSYEILETTDTDEGVDVAIRFTNVDLATPFLEEFKPGVTKFAALATSEALSGENVDSQGMGEQYKKLFATCFKSAVSNATETKDYYVVIPLVRDDSGALHPHQTDVLAPDLFNALLGGLPEGLKDPWSGSADVESDNDHSGKPKRKGKMDVDYGSSKDGSK